jgi:hypothetical protein
MTQWNAFRSLARNKWTKISYSNDRAIEADDQVTGVIAAVTLLRKKCELPSKKPNNERRNQLYIYLVTEEQSELKAFQFSKG